MDTLFNQRWRACRDSYRPVGEPIRTLDYEVAEIPGDDEAKRFVLEHHYAGTYPAARFRYGIYHGQHGLRGVAVFSVPCHPAVLTNVFGDKAEAVELGRFVLYDSVPANGESWFIGRCHQLLRREGVAGVVSFSDPLPRVDQGGRIVFPGHIGNCYQATNAKYLRRSKARPILLLPDGTVLHDRARQKLYGRTHTARRGWDHVVKKLEHHGAPGYRGRPNHPDDLAGWADLAIPRVTRTVRHPGNHRYAWALDKRLRILLPEASYPKFTAVPAH